MQENDLASLAKGIFSSLTQEELSVLSACMKIAHFPTGEMLNFQRGFNVLLSGEVGVLRESMEIGQMTFIGRATRPCRAL